MTDIRLSTGKGYRYIRDSEPKDTYHMSRDDIRRMSTIAFSTEGETTRMRHDVFAVASSTAFVSASVNCVDIFEDLA